MTEIGVMQLSIPELNLGMLAGIMCRNVDAAHNRAQRAITMSANLDTSLGFVALAFTGPISRIWHRSGQSIDEKAKELGRPLTMDEIWNLAGCNFTVDKVPLFVDLNGPRYDHIAPHKRMLAYPERFAHVRSDTGAPVGMGSDRYHLVQPEEIKETFIAYAMDHQITTVGSLNGGRRIWAQADFGEHTVAGDKHSKKLLLSTTFDTTENTTARICETRVVCENTFMGASREQSPVVRISHRSKYNAEHVRNQLTKIAAGFEKYKAVGDALAGVKLSKEELSAFLRDVLDIPHEAKKEDVSTRKLNQRQAIIDAMLVTANERAVTKTEDMDAFTVFQGVTRWVDHDRNKADTEARLFGSGSALKDKAMGLLMPRILDKVPV